MTTRAFGVHTPRELLTRAEHEIVKLEKSMTTLYLVQGEGEHKVGSMAATCAGTLWNLVDWLANSNDPATKAALAKAHKSRGDSGLHKGQLFGPHALLGNHQWIQAL